MYLVLEKHREWTRMSTKFLPHRQRDHGENPAKKLLRKLCVLCVFVVKVWFYSRPFAVEICICVNWRPSSVETGFQAIGSASA